MLLKILKKEMFLHRLIVKLAWPGGIIDATKDTVAMTCRVLYRLHTKLRLMLMHRVNSRGTNRLKIMVLEAD